MKKNLQSTACSIFITLSILFFISACSHTGPIRKLEIDKIDSEKGYTSIICIHIKSTKAGVYTMKRPYIFLSELSDDNVKLLNNNPEAKITVSYARRVYASNKWENGYFDEYLYMTVKPGNYLFLGTAFTKYGSVGPKRKIIKVPPDKFVYLGSIIYNLNPTDTPGKLKYIVDYRIEHSNNRLQKALKSFNSKYPKLSDKFRGRVYSSFSLISK